MKGHRKCQFMKWWLIAAMAVIVINMLGCAVHQLPKGLSVSKDAATQINFFFLLSERAGVELGGCMRGHINEAGDVRIQSFYVPRHYRASALDVQFEACRVSDLGFFHTHIVAGLAVCQFSQKDIEILLARPNPVAAVMCRINQNIEFRLYLRKNVIEQLFPWRQDDFQPP